MKKQQQTVNTKTVVKTALITVAILVGLILVLILDYAVIVGAWKGLQFIGNEISGFVNELTDWIPETEAKEEAPETEKKRSSEEILKEENEKLDRIMAAQKDAKGE